MRRRTGDTPIARRIALLLVIPVTSLVGLWGFAAASSIDAALEKQKFTDVYEGLGEPVNVLTVMLQVERTLAAALIAVPGQQTRQQFQEQAARTDGAVRMFTQGANREEVTGASADLAKLPAFAREFSVLSQLRADVLDGADALPTVEQYSRLTDRLLQVLTQVTHIQDVDVDAQMKALLNTLWARDIMMRQDAILIAVRGDLGTGARTEFARLAGARAKLSELGEDRMVGDLRDIGQSLTGAPAYLRYVELEAAIARSGITSPTMMGDWTTTTQALSPLWLQVATEAGGIADLRVREVGDEIMLRLYLVAGVGFLAVLLSGVLFFRFIRGISADLRRLQHTAQDLARVRLPRVVGRLRRGEQVDVRTEAPDIEGGGIREVRLVAEAFANVQRTAVDVAVSEAALRGGINQIFVNLSWRSQSLLQRQLRLLEAMEHKAKSSEELDDLFRLDHLTTRMRRHAEGLVILAGAQTVRAWDHPVTSEDVVRAALQEIEDYRRVEVVTTAPVSVAAHAVADVIHLLAELIENAAVFSPPTSEVAVRLDVVANGLVVEIIDRGIGITPDELVEINRRLTEAPDFTLADSDRLGLFVVARLAARHGIRVRLQPSPYGGTTAVVLVPMGLVLADRAAEPARDRVADTTRTQPFQAVPAPAPIPAAAPPPRIPGRIESAAPGRLPRRTRQQNLAPELRGGPRHAREDEAFDDFVEPDPESSRDLMSSLHSGWEMARMDEPSADQRQDHRDERGDR
ncbi:nitrate- and nitrite sensing domain-containing protein [Actinocorallia sp. A-T 12471]|uniref:sensor histidine kinase n=1 Tax=Actinocorallia sp. A-T 12471 TaxID=3089813 RepID=UPI0029CDCD06|nr:nitrate- and nitrite sensing domain-containing protein [Actinocorallia sp. A-T 12471]MDX6740926.1 ATP-binding protein [Actinocorallia sp. A-T 12471]